MKKGRPVIQRSAAATTTNNMRTCALVTLLAVSISACGGSGSADAPPSRGASNGKLVDFPDNTISKVGTVIFSALDSSANVAIGAPSGVMEASAEFLDYKQTLDDNQINALYGFDDIGTCRISIDSTDDSQDIGLESDQAYEKLRANARALKAGNALSVLTPSGSWPDLLPDGYEHPYYDLQADGSTLGNLPPGSTINIPGAEFPAFSGITIPPIARFTDVSVAKTIDNSITPDTEITWAVPASSLQGDINFIFIYAEVADDASNAWLMIDMFCSSSDNGKFIFPENAKQLFSTYSIPAEDLTLARMRVGNAVQDDAALVVINGAVYYF